MYRIKLASGEEAAYLSLDEFAIALQHGVVDADALIHHARAGTWLPIESHPHYELARSLATSMPLPDPDPLEERAPLLSAEQPVRSPPRKRPTKPQPTRQTAQAPASESTPAPKPVRKSDPVAPETPSKGPTATRPTHESPPDPVSLKAAADGVAVEELTSHQSAAPARKRSTVAERPMAATTEPYESPFVESVRRSDWNQGYTIDTLEGLPLGPHRLVRKRSRRPLVMAIVVGTLAILGRWSTLPDAPVSVMSSGIAAGLEAPPPHQPIVGAPGAPSAPADVETDEAPRLVEAPLPRETYQGAYRQAQVELRESLISLEFGNLFVTRRLTSSDSVRVARRLVIAARNVVGVYRNHEVRIDRYFERPSPSLRESYATAMMADSLFDAIDGIYSLLLAQEGQFRLRNGRLRFNDRQAAASYDELASWLRARVEWYRIRPAGMPLTIGPLVLAASAPPPPRVTTGS